MKGLHKAAPFLDKKVIIKLEMQGEILGWH